MDPLNSNDHMERLRSLDRVGDAMDRMGNISGMRDPNTSRIIGGFFNSSTATPEGKKGALGVYTFTGTTVGTIVGISKGGLLIGGPIGLGVGAGVGIIVAVAKIGLEKMNRNDPAERCAIL